MVQLVDTDHSIDPQEVFDVIYRVAFISSKGVRLREMCASEAICTRIAKPDLRRQKSQVQCLALAWLVIGEGESRVPY